jgi:hypothetical protein
MSDNTIKELMDLASKKGAQIKSTERYANKTNLSFPVDESSLRSNINLNVVMNATDFVKILATLKKERNFFDEAAQELGLKASFKWGGFSYDDWKSDIQNRVDTLNLKKKRAELKEIQDTLKDLMSPEMKTNMKLEEIKKRLLTEE